MEQSPQCLMPAFIGFSSRRFITLQITGLQTLLDFFQDFAALFIPLIHPRLSLVVRTWSADDLLRIDAKVGSGIESLIETGDASLQVVNASKEPFAFFSHSGKWIIHNI